MVYYFSGYSQIFPFHEIFENVPICLFELNHLRILETYKEKSKVYLLWENSME